METTAGDVVVGGGGGLGANHYAMIGHGGYATRGDHSGNITVNASGAAGSVHVLAGRSDGNGTSTATADFAQIGHGGYEAKGDHGGVGNTLTVTAGEDIIVTGGASGFDSGGTDGNRGSYAQIGAGGYNADFWIGTVGVGNDMDLHVTAGGDIQVSAGGDRYNYAQIGNGGGHNGGGNSGDINVQAGGGISFSGGLGDDSDDIRAYAQLGHGGYEAEGTHSGAIAVTAGAAGITFTAGDTSDNYVQLGHGGSNSQTGGVGVGEGNSGDITVSSVGTITFTAGTTKTVATNDGRLYAQLGHGGYDADNSTTGGDFAGPGHNGAITVVSSMGDVLLRGGDVANAVGAGGGYSNYVQLGHGGRGAHGDHFGNVTVRAGIAADGTTVTHADSSITLLAGNSNSSSAEPANYAQIGHGGYYARGDLGKAGETITVLAAADVTARAGSSGSQASGTDGNRRSYVQIGNGGIDADKGDSTTAGNTADITVKAGGDIQFIAGEDQYNYAQLGNGGILTQGRHSGDINVTAGGLINFAGGLGDNTNDYRAYAHLGHGGYDAEGTHSGTIDATANGAGGIAFSAGDIADNYVQLGHGGSGARTSGVGVGEGNSGDITVSSVGSITFLAGTTSAVEGASQDGRLYAQLGHGGHDADSGLNDPGHHGDITVVSSGGDVLVQAGDTAHGSAGAGTGAQHYAMIGHGGYSARGSHYGDITVRAGVAANGTSITHAGSSISLGAGSTNDNGNQTYNYAQIGHGGSQATGNHGLAGDETVVLAAGDIDLRGGATNAANNDNQRSYVQVGNGGFNTDADHSGAITVRTLLGDLSLSSGAPLYNYAQIGNGGGGADGNHAGDIDVIAARDVLVSGQNVTNTYALIGHGDELGGNDNGETIEGEVTLRVGRNLGLLKGFVGHNIDGGGTYTSGNTFVGVGRDLAADADSQFNSAATGELRFYLHPVATDSVNAATKLNGVAHGPAPAAGFPNDMGLAAFGAGSYLGGAESNPVAGSNFAYYHLDWAGDYNYNVESAEATAIKTALGGADVVLSSELGSTQSAFGALLDWDGGTQFVRVGSAIKFTSTHDLTMRASGHIMLEASVQNDGDGDLNIAAGWDKTTDVPAADFKTSIRDDSWTYGWNEGSVLVGGATGVSVGSRLGETSVVAYGLDLRAGNASGAHAQIGYFNTGAADPATGNITVGTWDGGVQMNGGGSSNAFSKIGHGGMKDLLADNSGDISVVSEYGDVLLKGGTGADSYTQIGHGSNNANPIPSTLTGSINVSADRVSIAGGTSHRTYSQIGHGGHEITGDQNGDITVVAQTGAVSVGSRSASGENSYSLIGHGGSSNGSGDKGLASDTILVTAATDVVLQGADGDIGYAMIGNGGRNLTGGTHAGNIEVTALSGDVHLSGSMVARGGSSAQIGNGGQAVSTSTSGDITVVVDLGSVILEAGNSNFFGPNSAQIGHGGYGNAGDHGAASDTIKVQARQDIRLTAETANDSFAQIGNGGVGAEGHHAGTIDIQLEDELVLTASLTGLNRYALIGHGDQPGDVDTGSVEGDISVRVGNTASVTGARGGMIGHQVDAGGTYGSGNTFIGVGDSFTADQWASFNSTPGGELRFYIGGSDNIDPLAKLNGVEHGGGLSGDPFPNDMGGHIFGTGPYLGGAEGNPVAGNFAFYHLPAAAFNYVVDGAQASNITTALGNNDVTLATNLRQINFGALYDWDGGTQFIDINSGIAYDANQNLSLLATGDITFDASVLNANATGGDINVAAGWDGTTATGMPPTNFALITGDSSSYGLNNGLVRIGDGTQTAGIAVGSRAGGTNVYGYQLDMNGSNAYKGHSQIGYHSAAAGSATTGAIRVAMKDGGITMDGGGLQGSYVQIGHGGYKARNESYSGDVTVSTGGGDIVARAGGATMAYAQLGNGGALVRADHSGDLSVSTGAGGAVSFIGGGGSYAYAQLGNGGRTAAGTHSGAIAVDSGAGISFSGGAGAYAYAQLGHGGHQTKGAGHSSGGIDVDAVGTVGFSGGTGNRAYAQLGLGGYQAVGSHTGALEVDAGGLVFAAGTGGSSYAQLGNGGGYAYGNHGGALGATIAGDVAFTGNGGHAYAQLGHGGAVARGDHSGDLSLVTTAGGAVSFSGGGGSYAYAQLGNGGRTAAGAHSGAVAVDSASTISFGGGGGAYAYAQLGHGGHQAKGAGHSSGGIEVDAVGAVDFSGGTGYLAYAQLGLGGFQAAGSHTAGLDVDAGSLLMRSGPGTGAYVQVGNGGRQAKGDQQGGITVRTRTGGLEMDASGGGGQAYVQLGQGGADADGDHSGSIGVEVAGDLAMESGASTVAYTQIGHAGAYVGGTADGDITVVATGALGLAGGAGGTVNYSQIGHGGAKGATTAATGAIDISGVGGAVTVTDGVNATADRNWARIGHGNADDPLLDPDIDPAVLVP